MSKNIEVDVSQLNKFAVEVKGMKKFASQDTATVIRNTAFKVQRGAMSNLAKNGSVKTGHLRASIDVKANLFEATIRANTKYAMGVEEGTRAHIIRPKKGKFLFWKGASHPVKMVKHPGSKAKPYLVPSFEKETQNIIKDLEKLIKW